MAAVYRFADPEWRLKADTNLAGFVGDAGDSVRTEAYPTMSLDDEVRYTLGQRVRVPLFFSFGYPAGSAGSLPLSFPVPPTFLSGDRIALDVVTSFDGVRKHYPPLIAKVAMRGGAAGIQLQLDVPDEYANRAIDIDVQGTPVPSAVDLYHRTAPVTVPPKSYLDFSFGVDAAAWGQGPVEFRVLTCAAQNCETLFRESVDPAIPDERKWQTRRVALDEIAGREVSFSFESRLLAPKADAFSLPVWANPTVYAPAVSPDARPNIILISLDTLAANHLPTYGYEFPTAPFLDGVLARDGVVVERAVAAATTTPQSHMSMFTSVQPCRHGVITGMERVRSELVTLAEVLRAAGYETGAVTEDGWLGYEHGFGRGFNFYVENKSANVMTPEGQFDLTLTKARSWIKRNGDKRFFLFLHTFQVHEPYTPPAEYTKLFRERGAVEVREATPRPLRDLVAYDQEIRYTDDQLRDFFGFLRDRRLLDNTVIVVTSDHGEEFFQHGLQGHGRNLFEEVTRVPMILWGPGRVPRGERNTQTAGHIDLMPTILALAGVSVPEQATGRNLLSPVPTQGSATADFRFTESRVTGAVTKDYELIEVLSPSFMVQRGHLKMARYRERDGHRYEAYDLEVDPQETNNRLPAEAVAFEPMRRLLDEYEAACAEGIAREDGDEPSRRIELDPEREQKLRALGYLE